MQRSLQEEFLSGVQFVGFDFDNTLVDEKYSIKKKWERVLQNYLYLAEDLSKIFFEIYEKKELNYKFHLDDTFEALGISKKLIPTIVSEFLATESQEEKLLEGALELITLLKKKRIKVGILTKGTESYQKNRIRQSGLETYVDFVQYGDTYQKPDPMSFKIFMDELGVENPSKLLYIGDDMDYDIIPASSLDIKTCIVGMKKLKTDLKNTIQVTSLKELLNYFKHHESK